MSVSRGVLVTGASRGVGAAAAKAFAAAGDRVVLHCRGAVDEANAVLASLPGEGHAVVTADLGSSAEIPSLVEESAAVLGRIDVLVNNAALYVEEPVAGSRRIGHPLAETSYEEWVAAWRKTLAINLEGAAHLTWCVARQMLDVAPAGWRQTGRDRQCRVARCVPRRARRTGVRGLEGGFACPGAVAGGVFGAP